MEGNTKTGISNPLRKIYPDKVDAILYANELIGTVRGKSANGLMIHSKLFNIVAIVDDKASGVDTAKVCQGVNISVPVYATIDEALTKRKAKTLIFLQDPSKADLQDVRIALVHGLDLINTSFSFIRNLPDLTQLINEYNCRFFDLRDVADLHAYPNTEIIKRKAKVVFVTGTDCGLGKRTAAFELTERARQRGIKATMYATGQTGLLLGEKGTVADSLVIEYANGVISQHVCELNNEGYELIFVEGQSDIFHPANSAVSLALLHGANPDCVIIVHDESRDTHKGFDEESPLYQMHQLKRHIDTINMLSLPCGPEYNTVGIATIGKENIYNISGLMSDKDIPVADVRMDGGADKLLDGILSYFTSRSLLENFNFLKN